MLFFYGGCWGGCNTFPKEHYRFVGDTLASSGYVVVIADYRLYPQVLFPEIMADAALATSWTVEHALEFNADPNRLYLMGHSAGAHMAAMLSVDERYLADETRSKVAGFIGLAGPYDFLPLEEDYQRAVFGPQERYPDSQPINFVDGSEPPMLLLYGNDDTTVYERNIENMASKIEDQGGTVIANRYDDMTHISILTALARPFRSGKPVLTDIEAFIGR